MMKLVKRVLYVQIESTVYTCDRTGNEYVPLPFASAFSNVSVWVTRTITGFVNAALRKRPEVLPTPKVLPKAKAKAKAAAPQSAAPRLVIVRPQVITTGLRILSEPERTKLVAVQESIRAISVAVATEMEFAVSDRAAIAAVQSATVAVVHASYRQAEGINAQTRLRCIEFRKRLRAYEDGVYRQKRAAAQQSSPQQLPRHWVAPQATPDEIEHRRDEIKRLREAVLADAGQIRTPQPDELRELFMTAFATAYSTVYKTGEICETAPPSDGSEEMGEEQPPA